MALPTHSFVRPIQPRALRGVRFRDEVIFSTGSLEYHCKDDVCVDVRYGSSGESVSAHPLVGLRAAAAVSRSTLGFPAFGRLSTARPGHFLCFVRDGVGGAERFTGQLTGVHYLDEAKAPASVRTLSAGPDVSVAIITLAETAIASRLVYVNESLATLSGYSSQQLLSHSALLIAGARPSKAHVRAVIEALSATQPRSVVALQRKTRPNGTTYDVALRIAPVFGSDGVAQALLLQRELSR